MRDLRNNQLADCRSAAADAKVILLNAYRTAKENGEPTRLARQAERALIVEARAVRRFERDRLNLEERTRLEANTAAENTVAEAAIVADAQARERAENARVALLVEDEATRKAERDRRYAVRKTRQA